MSKFLVYSFSGTTFSGSGIGATAAASLPPFFASFLSSFFGGGAFSAAYACAA